MTTTNLGMTLPTVGADTDNWGNELNANLTVLDNQLAGAIYGLTLSAAGGTSVFGIAAGTASGMTLSGATTKGSGGWAVGSGNGALDTGSIANNSWYHVWQIRRSDTGVVDVLVSSSATSPAMPTNYDRKRRIGAMKTDGAGQWVKFIQIGDQFLWDAPVKDASAVTVGTTNAVLVTLTVPPGIRVTPVGNLNFSYGGTNGICYLSSPDVSDQIPSSTSGAFTGAVTSTYIAVNQPLSATPRTNSSAQIRVRFSASDVVYNVDTKGWIDARGGLG